MLQVVSSKLPIHRAHPQKVKWFNFLNIIEGKIEGKRWRGWPRQTWMDYMKHLKHMQKSNEYPWIRYVQYEDVTRRLRISSIVWLKSSYLSSSLSHLFNMLWGVHFLPRQSLLSHCPATSSLALKSSRLLLHLCSHHSPSYITFHIIKPLARNGNFFKNAVINICFTVTSKITQLHIFAVLTHKRSTQVQTPTKKRIRII